MNKNDDVLLTNIFVETVVKFLFKEYWINIKHERIYLKYTAFICAVYLLGYFLYFIGYICQFWF